MTVNEYIDFFCMEDYRIRYENSIVYDSTETAYEYPAFIGESVVQKAYFDDPEVVEIEI